MPAPEVTTLVWGVAVAALAIGTVSLYMSIRLYMVLSRVRKESRKSFEVSQHVDSAWRQFSESESQARERLNDRVDRFEETTKDRVERFEKIAGGTRERLIKLEQYLKEFFEVELKTVFDSFDKTVSSILEQMKAELLRGLERIEDIQAFVDSKSFAQDRILDGEGSVYRLLAEGGASSGGETASEESEPVVRPAEEDDEPNPADGQADSRYRLEADEAD